MASRPSAARIVLAVTVSLAALATAQGGNERASPYTSQEDVHLAGMRCTCAWGCFFGPAMHLMDSVCLVFCVFWCVCVREYVYDTLGSINDVYSIKNAPFSVRGSVVFLI